MDQRAILSRISEIYKKGGNIIQFLKKENKQEKNSVEDIMISYDFQAGEYTDYYYKHREMIHDRARVIASYFNYMDTEIKSVLECGVGEATTLVPVLNELNSNGARYRWVGGGSLMVKD